MDREVLESLGKSALIDMILAQAAVSAEQGRQIAALTARAAELEVKLGLPPKTPDNSSSPPSRGHKPSEQITSRDKRKAHPGAHRPRIRSRQASAT